MVVTCFLLMYGSFSFGPRDQKFRRFILREWNFRPLKVEGGGESSIFFTVWREKSNFPYWDNATIPRRLPSSRKPSAMFCLDLLFWPGLLFLGSLYPIGRWCTLGQIVRPAGFYILFRGALFKRKPSRLKWQEFRAIIRSLEPRIDPRDLRVKGFE